MNWITLKRALSDFFENVGGSTEEFASHMNVSVDELTAILSGSSVPSYDVGRKLEYLLLSSISFRASRYGEEGLRPGWYRVYPHPGTVGPVFTIRISADGEADFKHIGEDQVTGVVWSESLFIRNLEAEAANAE